MDTVNMVRVWDIVLGVSLPIATVVAAFIALLANIKVRKQADINEELNRKHAEKIAELNRVFEIASMQAQERFSLRARALVESARLVGETCYYLERFLTPYTSYEPMPKEKLIEKAEECFESLLKFHWENHLFLYNNNEAITAISNLMGAINGIKNSQPEDAKSRVELFLSGAKSALGTIRDEYQRELRSNFA